MGKYLDASGLSTVWNKIKSRYDNKVPFVATYGSTSYSAVNGAWQNGQPVFCQYKNGIIPLTGRVSSNFYFSGVAYSDSTHAQQKVSAHITLTSGGAWSDDKTMYIESQDISFISMNDIHLECNDGVIIDLTSDDVWFTNPASTHGAADGIGLEQILARIEAASASDASMISYDSSVSELGADNVQDAIDNLTAELIADERTTAMALNDLNTRIDECCGMMSITYSELKDLRDGGELIPGTQYRIIDYVTMTDMDDETTPQEYNHRSVAHPFDIIVTADSSSVLNENARAAQHSGDSYFANSNLSAWKLKYSLDNDAVRFNWAADSGKGVIYEMIDEFGNESPYDFKNIQFVRRLNTSGRLDDNGAYTFVYHFNDYNLGNCRDHSLTNAHCYDNIEKPCYIFYNFPDDDSAYPQMLNNGVFLGIAVSTFCGNDCSAWTCGNYCSTWTCGNGCSDWTCGDICSSWSCGNYCSNWTCGDGCSSWSCGNDCSNWTCGDYCSHWTCGNDCWSWSCGDYCSHWTCGNECLSWSITDTNNNVKSYCSAFTIADKISGLRVIVPVTTTSANCMQNFHICSGVSSTSVTLSCPAGIQYEWKVAKNSSGDVKQYCEADIIA